MPLSKGRFLDLVNDIDLSKMSEMCRECELGLIGLAESPRGSATGMDRRSDVERAVTA